jgi:hypothetical protein
MSAAALLDSFTKLLHDALAFLRTNSRAQMVLGWLSHALDIAEKMTFRDPVVALIMKGLTALVRMLRTPLETAAAAA